MQRIPIIIANFIILSIILWINHEILHIFHYRKKILRTSLLGGGSAALIIYFYPTIIQSLPLSRSISHYHSILSLVPLIGLGAILSFIAYRGQGHKRLKVSIIRSIIGMISYSSTSIITNHPLQVTIGFFLLVAFIEEFLKILGADNYNSRIITGSDIIILGIISGLAYASVENIIVSINIQQTIVRMPLFLIHSIFTSIITYGLFQSQKKKKITPYMISIMGVIRIHTAYNTRGSSRGIRIWIISITALYLIYTKVQYHSSTTYVSTLANK